MTVEKLHLGAHCHQGDSGARWQLESHQRGATEGARIADKNPANGGIFLYRVMPGKQDNRPCRNGTGDRVATVA